MNLAKSANPRLAPFKVKFTERKPFKYWDDKQNILQFFKELKTKYNINTPEDWNLITRKEINLNGGRCLLDKYSMFDLKCIACPEGKLIFEKHNNFKPSRYWEKKENISLFLDKLKNKYNLITPEDWNSITTKKIKLNGGGVLFEKYSLFDLKCMACPEGKLIYKNQKATGYWKDLQNIHQFLNELKQKYNINTPEDWNLLSVKQIKLHGGISLLDKYTMFDLKCIACPEGKLLFNKPKKYKSSIPSTYWEDENNRNEFINQVKTTYNLKTPMDWKRISRHQIRLLGGYWLFTSNNNYLENTRVKFETQTSGEKYISYSLKELLSGSDFKQFRPSQRWLFLLVQQLYPEEEIVEDYFHSKISRQTGFHVQFDIFLIKRNIAIEYHGVHHYTDTPARFTSIEMNQKRDLEKEKLCKENGITLIIVPYWWDNKLESLRDHLYPIINKII